MTAFTETSKCEVPFSIIVDAYGELVSLSGVLRIFTHITKNQNRYEIKTQYKPMGVIGVGLYNNVIYRGIGLTEEITTASVTGFPYETTYINSFRIIGRVPSENYEVHETFHVTVDANREVTAFLSNTSVKRNG